MMKLGEVPSGTIVGFDGKTYRTTDIEAGLNLVQVLEVVKIGNIWIESAKLDITTATKNPALPTNTLVEVLPQCA